MSLSIFLSQFPLFHDLIFSLNWVGVTSLANGITYHQDESMDYFKKQQLRELAILNGTLREESPSPSPHLSPSVSPFNSTGMKRAKTGRWSCFWILICLRWPWFEQIARKPVLLLEMVPDAYGGRDQQGCLEARRFCDTSCDISLDEWSPWKKFVLSARRIGACCLVLCIYPTPKY